MGVTVITDRTVDPVAITDARGPAAQVFEQRLASTGNVADFQRMLAHNPELLHAQEEYLQAIRRHLTMSPRLRELVIMAIATTLQCRYMWGRHWDLALEAGISPDTLLALTDPDADELLSQSERAAVRYIRPLARDGAPAPGTRTSALDELGNCSFVEANLLVSLYVGSAAAISGLGVELESEFSHVPPLPHRSVGERMLDVREGEEAR